MFSPMTFWILLAALLLVVIILRAAPTVTSRIVPTGWLMPDGFKTTLATAANPSIKFWEIEVTPLGWEGGEPINITTQLNNVFRTKYPQTLVENTPVSAIVGYDPDVETQIAAIMNVPSSWTVKHPDHSTTSFWGALKTFQPSSRKIGEFPTANITITVMNWDAANSVEAGPVFNGVPGT